MSQLYPQQHQHYQHQQHQQAKTIQPDVNFLIQEYLCHHLNRSAKPIPCPLRSSNPKRWCSPWDAKFIDSVALDLSLLYDLGEAADYYKLADLRDLVCAKIAAIARECYPHEVKSKLSVRPF